MPTGRYLESEEAAFGGQAIRDAASVAADAIPHLAERVRTLMDGKPAGGGEEGARFEEAHESVASALEAAPKLRALIEEMAENIIAGASGAVAEDELASQILAKASDVRDIPDIPF